MTKSWGLLGALIWAMGGAARAADAPADWNPREQFLKALVQEVPAMLQQQDPATGRFGSEPWICDDQNLIFPLAAAWAIADSGNPYYRDERVLEAVMKGGDALVGAQDKYGMWEFRKKDNSTWGQTAQPWTYSRWVRAFHLIKEAMPADRRQYWEQGLKLGFERIGKSLRSSHNKTCHLAMALYCAGLCFDREDWKQTATNFMAKVVAAQSPQGYWSEHSGPVVSYNFVYSEALGAYFEMSQDRRVIEPLRRAALFHSTFTYPNGASVETVDERNPYSAGIKPGNVGFSYTSEGRSFLLRQFDLLRWQVDADTAATFLLHGGMGPGAPLAVADEEMTVLGANQALVLRRKPWFICLSALVAPLATNRWIQDRQNFVSIFHERAGLIIGGGNTKLQPFWSSFTVGNTAQLRHRPGDQAPDFRPKGDLIHIPSRAQLQADKAEPSLSLDYGREECRLAVRPLDNQRLTLVCEATSRSGKPVEGHVTFLPPAKARIRTAAGKTATLGETALAWSASDIGAWFQYGDVRATVPAGARLLWPMKRHNPYKKDGSSTLDNARLVLCLPFSSSALKHEVTVEVTERASQK
jgi:hypothetical protein